MSQKRECCKCGKEITDKDIIGINRKLLGARTQKFMCLKHLEVLQFRIEDLKDSGCPLFR